MLKALIFIALVFLVKKIYQALSKDAPQEEQKKEDAVPVGQKSEVSPLPAVKYQQRYRDPADLTPEERAEIDERLYRAGMTVEPAPHPYVLPCTHSLYIRCGLKRVELRPVISARFTHWGYSVDKNRLFVRRASDGVVLAYWNIAPIQYYCISEASFDYHFDKLMKSNPPVENLGYLPLNEDPSSKE